MINIARCWIGCTLLIRTRILEPNYEIRAPAPIAALPASSHPADCSHTRARAPHATYDPQPMHTPQPVHTAHPLHCTTSRGLRLMAPHAVASVTGGGSLVWPAACQTREQEVAPQSLKRPRRHMGQGRFRSRDRRWPKPLAPRLRHHRHRRHHQNRRRSRRGSCRRCLQRQPAGRRGERWAWRRRRQSIWREQQN